MPHAERCCEPLRNRFSLSCLAFSGVRSTDTSPVAKMMYFELLDSPVATASAVSAASSSTPSLMDLTEESQSSAAASAPASSSSCVVKCVQEWRGNPRSGRVSTMCVWRPDYLLVGTDTHVLLVQRPVPTAATAASSTAAAAASSTAAAAASSTTAAAAPSASSATASAPASSAPSAPPKFKTVLTMLAPFPIWHVDAVVPESVALGRVTAAPKFKPERFVMVDQRQGAQLWCVHKATQQTPAAATGVKPRTAWFKLLQSDPYGRVARQAVLYEACAPMQPMHTLSPHQAGNPISVSPAVAAAPPHDVQLLRMVGVDVFGRIFVLRQDPADETAIIDNKPAPALASAHVPSARAAAAAAPSASSSAPKSAHPSTVVSTSLVQEACFQLGSTPSRIRMLPRLGVAQPLFLVSSLLGSMHAVRELLLSQVSWLRSLQHQLSGHSSCRSLVGNHHASYRSQTGVHGGAGADSEQMIDGDLLATFFTLSLAQQQLLCSRLPKIDGAERLPWKVIDELEQLLHVDI